MLNLFDTCRAINACLLEMTGTKSLVKRVRAMLRWQALHRELANFKG